MESLDHFAKRLLCSGYRSSPQLLNTALPLDHEPPSSTTSPFLAILYVSLGSSLLPVLLHDMSVSLDEISDVLLPRRYQEEIFVRAQQGNVIAALDTGSGKTYISTLLIKWIVALDSARGKIVVFLVPKVALVQQQGEFIAKQTSLRVRQFSGATAHEMGDREGWKKEFDDSDVFVMTGKLYCRTCVVIRVHIYLQHKSSLTS